MRWPDDGRRRISCLAGLLGHLVEDLLDFLRRQVWRADAVFLQLVDSQEVLVAKLLAADLAEGIGVDDPHLPKLVLGKGALGHRAAGSIAA